VGVYRFTYTHIDSACVCIYLHVCTLRLRECVFLHICTLKFSGCVYIYIYAHWDYVYACKFTCMYTEITCVHMFTYMYTRIACVCICLQVYTLRLRVCVYIYTCGSVIVSKCHKWPCHERDLVTNGFWRTCKAVVFSKTVRNLAYNEHVALSHLLSAGHGLALGYTWLAGWRRLSPREGRTTPMRQWYAPKIVAQILQQRETYDRPPLPVY
jgi:hypothetical protein